MMDHSSKNNECHSEPKRSEGEESRSTGSYA